MRSQVLSRKKFELGSEPNLPKLPVSHGFIGLKDNAMEFCPPYIFTGKSITPSLEIVVGDGPDPILFDKAESFVLAAAHARKLGHSLEYHLTIAWPEFNDTGDFHNSVRRQLQDWLKYHEGLAAFVWVKETSTHPHSHFLLSLKPSKAATLRKLVCKWIKADCELDHLPSGTVSLKPIERRYDRDKQIRNRIRYLLKGAELYTRYFFDCTSKPDGGETAGKCRIGWSRDLGHAARQREGGVIASGEKKTTPEMRDVAAARYGSIKLKTGVTLLGCAKRKRTNHAG